MISGAERLRSAVADGDDGIALRLTVGAFQNGFEDFRVKQRHVAGDDQIPRNGRPGEGRVEAAEGTRAADSIENDRSGTGVPYGWMSHDDHAAGCGMYYIDGAGEQRSSVPQESGLVRSHAGATAAGQDKTRRVERRHAPMITLRKSIKICLASSKMFQKCFIIALSMTVMACFASAEGRKVTSVVRTDFRTGKLIRRTVVSPATQQTQEQRESSVTQAAQASIQQIIEESAARNQVEAPLIHSVIRAESGFNPLAVSNKGAQGLMQLIPATAKRFGVNDSFDSKENVEGGVKYLRYLIDLFHGDYTQAVAAYNAGEGAVTKYGGVPPYQETRNYVATVARNLEQERRARAAASPVMEPGATQGANQAADPEEQYSPITASVGPDGRITYRTP